MTAIGSGRPFGGSDEELFGESVEALQGKIYIKLEGTTILTFKK